LGPVCPTAFAPVQNRWFYWSEPYTYASGKTLDTIYSYQENEDASGLPIKNSHIEAFFWTKEYGKARWEAWYEKDDPLYIRSIASHEPAMQKCGIAGTKKFGERWLELGGCEDWTFTSNMETAHQPLTFPSGRSHVLSKNLLQFGDFAGGNIGQWQHWDVGANITSWEIKRNSTTKNYYLDFKCTTACDTNSVYQDANVSSLTGTKKIRYGALLKSSVPAGASVAVFLLDSAGQSIGYKVTPAGSLSAAWQHVDDVLEWDFSAKPIAKVRFQVYIAEQSALYSIDEAYVTPSL
jgi:hypothetical protein